MKIIYSKTSSSGNSSVIESSNGKRIIIDCGIKFNEVDKGTKYTLFKSEAILCTHFHQDHTKYLKQFGDLGVPIFINQETLLHVKADKGLRRVKPFLNLIQYDRKIDTGSFIIKPFELVHSSHSLDEETGFQKEVPCECTGFFIYEKESKEKMLWITDTMYVKNKFPPVDYLCVECNYFEVENYGDEVDHIESKTVEKRRLKSHMSFETCMRFINAQDLSKCKEIRLLHLSSKITDKTRRFIGYRAREEIKDKSVRVFV